MANLYTENDIIRFIYKECDLFEKIEMEIAMDEDSTLLETYQEWLAASQKLPKVIFSPKKISIDRILAYNQMA